MTTLGTGRGEGAVGITGGALSTLPSRGHDGATGGYGVRGGSVLHPPALSVLVASEMRVQAPAVIGPDVPIDYGELIRKVRPRHTQKWLARQMGLPPSTVRHWLYHHFSARHRREVALTLLAEFDRQDRERPLIRAQILAMIGDEDGNEVDCQMAGLLAG